MSLLIVIIFLALVFDYINGFHDAANSIATIVSTKVLTPFQAVLWAAFFNVVAFFIFTEHSVANTIAKTVHADVITLPVILSGLIAAIIWNLITWWFGIPSSSSHTLIGGFAGAAIAHAGFGSIEIEKITKTLMFIFIAPVMGMVIAAFISIVTIIQNIWVKISIIFVAVALSAIFIPFNDIIKWGLVIVSAIFCIFYLVNHFQYPHSAYRTGNMFKKLQLLSSAAFSVGHGGNDAQKVMGIITAALVANGNIASLQDMPNWVPMACYAAIGLGTLSGGWKIVKTMGTKITKVTPLEGVSAETAGAITLFMTEKLGIPVSTTHTITGSIIGVGATKRLSAVRWGVTVNLLWAWILTIPVSAVMAAIVFYITQLVGMK
ncbi:MAG: inorganic phosphate transporter [Chitinophagaceae bacterium]|nr:inorganic phosphate transporter [Chitinophagaceae bacterium]